MKWLIGFITVTGFNFSVWAVIGLMRFISEKFNSSKSAQADFFSLNKEQVAAVVPAHNEELTIRQTIKSLKRILPRENIYVGSDGSSDRTCRVATNTGVKVINIQPNRGKAGAIRYTINHFGLLNCYQAILIVDADSQIDVNYLKYALPLFNDPKTVAIAGHVLSKWSAHSLPRWNHFFSAYRIRLYRILQIIVRYGQTWKYANVTTIAPGFVSMYRTQALRKINIDAPGLIIEDYNMTFEVHHKKLGRIAYNPKVSGTTDDPHSFRDYRRQVWRWNLGFWQTVRRHGFWPSMFSLTTGMMLMELLLYSTFFVSLPLIISWILITGEPLILPLPVLYFISVSLMLGGLIVIASVFLNDYVKTIIRLKIKDRFRYIGFIDLVLLLLALLGVYYYSVHLLALSPLSAVSISLSDLVIGILVADYLTTILAAIIDKKPLLLVYGLGFVGLRYVDALLFLAALPASFIIKSKGKWRSPLRQK